MLTNINRYVIICNEGLRLDAPDRTEKQNIRAKPYDRDQNIKKNWQDKLELRCYSLVYKGGEKRTSSLFNILKGDAANKLCKVLKLFRTRKASVMESLSETSLEISHIEILKSMVKKYNQAKMAVSLYHSDQTNSTNQRYANLSSNVSFVQARNSVLENIRDNYRYINNLETIDKTTKQIDHEQTLFNCIKVMEDMRNDDFVHNDLYLDYFVKFWERHKTDADRNIKTLDFSELPFVTKAEYLEKFANDCHMKQDASDA